MSSACERTKYVLEIAAIFLRPGAALAAGISSAGAAAMLRNSRRLISLSPKIFCRP
jgi:hypothetical protein